MATTETETRVQTYRVFRGVSDDETMWQEMPQISGEGKWGYHPDAEDIGTKYGAGEYLLIEVAPYASARFVVVVAETHYREQRDENDG